MNQYNVGDTIYLKTPELGYRSATIINFYGAGIEVELPSGYQFVIHEDEIDD